VILVVLAAIAIPMGIKYQKLAEFRKNESNAKTVYLAAESALTWYRSSGQWEDFCREVVRDGMRNDTFEETESEKHGEKRAERIMRVPGWLIGLTGVVIFLLIIGVVFSVISFLAPIIIPVLLVVLVVNYLKGRK